MSAEQTARLAKESFDSSQLLDASERHTALVALKEALTEHKEDILKANREDMDAARAAKLSPQLIKRLDLGTGDKYDSMLQGILDVDALADPTGQVTYARKLDEGLELHRVACPIGVLLVIFEARPEVIVNITALAIKSGASAPLLGLQAELIAFSFPPRQRRHPQGRQGVNPHSKRPVQGHPRRPRHHPAPFRLHPNRLHP